MNEREKLISEIIEGNNTAALSLLIVASETVNHDAVKEACKRIGSMRRSDQFFFVTVLVANLINEFTSAEVSSDEERMTETVLKAIEIVVRSGQLTNNTPPPGSTIQ